MKWRDDSNNSQIAPITRGTRLSLMSLTDAEFDEIVEM
jgi:predicted RNA-binding protein with PUA-like domain